MIHVMDHHYMVYHVIIKFHVEQTRMEEVEMEEIQIMVINKDVTQQMHHLLAQELIQTKMMKINWIQN